MKTLRVLLVEDSIEDAGRQIEHLESAGYSVYSRRVASESELLDALSEGVWDVVLSDYELRSLSGLDALNILREEEHDSPFIIISGSVGEETAASLMRRGVGDYLMKGNLTRLAPAVAREIQEAENRRVKREAEKALEHSEERLQMALSAAGLGAWEWDLETNDVFWSSECSLILGIPIAAAQVTDVHRLIVDEDREFVEQKHRHAIARRVPFTARFRIRRRDGEILWLSQSGKCEYDAKGKAVRMVGTLRDITRDKKAEDAIKQSEEDFRALVEATTQFVWQLDETGHLKDYPDWWIALTGQDFEASRRYGWLDHIHPDDRERVKEQYAHSIETGTPAKLDVRIRDVEGNYRHYNARGVPIASDDGASRRWICALAETTAQRSAEEKLKESEYRVRTILDAEPECVKVLSLEGKLMEMNPAGLAVVQAESQEQVLGATAKDLLLPEHVGNFEKALETVRRGGEAELAYEITGLKGRRRWLDMMAVPLRDAGGEIVSILAVSRDITEKRQAENELRQQAMLISQSSEAIFIWDFETGIKLWNDGCERLYGYTRDEAVGRFGYEMLRTEFAVPVAQFLSELRGRSIWSGEVKQTTKDGRTVFADSRYQVIDFDGQQLVLQTNRDITGRKSVENALRESEMRYRHLFENNPYPMWVYDVETLAFLAVNDAAVYRYGYSRENFLSMKITDIRPPEEAERVRAKAAETRFRIDTSGLWQHKKKDGTLIKVEITSHSLEFDEREARLVLANDVTERLRAEAALRRSEERYRELIENANDLIYTHDLDGNFTSLNRAGERMTGFTEADVLKMNVADFLSPKQMKTARQMMLDSGTDANPNLFEMELTSKDGRRVFLEINIRLVRHDGKPVGIQGVGRDITERKHADDALRESQQQLQQAQKLESIGILAGGMAHDFNNMLTAINGYSDLILRKLKPDDPIRRNIEEIRKAGERSAELTRQLLAFSRRQIMLPKVLNINEVIGETSAMLRRLIGENIQVTTKLDKKLGSVEADPGQLSQVLVNFVINSRDAMPNGGSIVIETANVELDENYASRHVSAEPGSYVMLAVSDNGIGMDEETRQRIFEPFFTTKEVGRGTGLGLSTVYGIVKQSGGNIWVYSEPGKGSTFKIYLPRVSRPAVSNGNADFRNSMRGTETILLVEDEEAVRHLSREILETCGYTVIEASNGAEALELCDMSKLRIDLLMTDIVMPELGGRELAEILARKRPAMKILFTSGYTDDAILRHGIIDEGTNFLQKPFTFDDLSKIIRNMLDS